MFISEMQCSHGNCHKLHSLEKIFSLFQYNTHFHKLGFSLFLLQTKISPISLSVIHFYSDTQKLFSIFVLTQIFPETDNVQSPVILLLLTLNCQINGMSVFIYIFECLIEWQLHTAYNLVHILSMNGAISIWNYIWN